MHLIFLVFETKLYMVNYKFVYLRVSYISSYLISIYFFVVLHFFIYNRMCNVSSKKSAP